MPPRKRKTTSFPLQAKRLADDCWCDCEISVRSSGPRPILNVQFHGLEEHDKDHIFTASEAKSRLRPQSKWLENGQCLQLQEGDIVLASRKSESGIVYFFDARLEKIHRKKHSSRSACKCAFELMWLDTKMKGNISTVQGNQIRQASQCNIQDHPIICEWLKSTSQENGYQPELSDVGSDVELQLQEEIDRITMMADYFAESTLKPSAEVADIRISSRRKVLATQKSRTKREIQSNNEVAQVCMSSRKGPQSEVLEDGTKAAAPFLFDQRPRLSHLAARAALAAAVEAMPSGYSSCGISPILVAKPLDTQVKKHEKQKRSARKRLDLSSVNAKDDEIKFKARLNGQCTAGDVDEQHKRRRAKRDSPLPCSGPSDVSPISRYQLGNQCELSSEVADVNIVIALPTDSSDDNMLQEGTDATCKDDETKYVDRKETQFTVKDHDVSFVRRTARRLKESMYDLRKTESSRKTLPNSETKNYPKTVSPERPSKRDRASASCRSSPRLRLNLQTATTATEDVDCGPRQAEEKTPAREITSADHEIRGLNGSRKRKQGLRVSIGN